MTLVEGFLPSLEQRRQTRSTMFRFVRARRNRAGAGSCLTEPVAGAVTITVDTDGHGHVGGLKRCASAWACPMCAPKVRQRRADEITQLVEAVQARGGAALLVTVTIPHGPADELRGLLDDLGRSWSRLAAGRWWTQLRDRFAIVGTVAATEITWGARGGWHPHRHVLFALDRPIDDATIVELWGALLIRWKHAVTKASSREPNAYSVQIERVVDPRNVAEYVADTGGWSIGAEIAAGPAKLGRSADRWSPFAILAAAACWGDADAAELWDIYELATAGRHALRASPGLFDAYGIRQADDEEAAQGPEVVDGIATVEVDPAHWVVLVDLGRHLDYIAAIEAWATAGALGRAPTPHDLLTTKPTGDTP